MVVRFPPFHVDLSDERLWHGTQSVHLTRKAWEVLRVLLEANGRLVTKDQLAQTVWNGTHVGDDSLTKVVRELRRALGDDQRAPRFIATVHGRGYRFVAPLGSAVDESTSSSPVRVTTPVLFGRDRQLSVLESWLEEARRGRRQVGFVSGEVGIGKSSLVTTFVAAATANEAVPLRLAGGQCVEQFGEADPFLPVIAALRRVCRNARAAAIVRAGRGRGAVDRDSMWARSEFRHWRRRRSGDPCRSVARAGGGHRSDRR
jgi:DNA-binding winged helix-turn-helix (wHTH) protein